MRSPYKIQGPALISFSGGRSSGYMLRHILDAHNGVLPDDVHVCFMNTGMERPETLAFVAECAERWGVKIVWLEYDPTADENTRVVNFSTASRKGEPFEALIRQRQFLPNPVARFCTTELKIRRSKNWMLWKGYEHWDNIIGYRGDEPRRVAKMDVASSRERWEQIAPMAQAGVTKDAVVAWWEEQDFDLRLPSVDGVTPAGNCDCCFLKGQYTLLELLRERPDWGDWWVKMETVAGALASKPSGGVFRIDRPDYARMRELAVMSEPLPFGADDAISCFCGD